jgi:phosphoribosylglycinamide formyltransferase 1
MFNLAVFSSGRGSSFRELYPLLKASSFAVKLIVSNNADASILKYAEDNKLKGCVINSKDLNREQYGRVLDKLLISYNIDVVILVGFMMILSRELVNKWDKKIINVHPSLLPMYQGMMDLSVHQAVIDNKEKETGCSVHFVTKNVDCGPIICQRRCKVLDNDNAKQLKARVQALEAPALFESLNKVFRVNYE